MTRTEKLDLKIVQLRKKLDAQDERIGVEMEKRVGLEEELARALEARSAAR